MTQPSFYRYGNLPNSYVPATAPNDLGVSVPGGQRCGNCYFMDGGYCHKWLEFVAINYWCESWRSIDPLNYLPGELPADPDDWESPRRNLPPNLKPGEVSSSSSNEATKKELPEAPSSSDKEPGLRPKREAK